MTSTRETLSRSFSLLAGLALMAAPVAAQAQSPAAPEQGPPPYGEASAPVPGGAAPAVTAQPPAPVPGTEKQETPTAPKGWKDLLVLEGLVDSYYLYNFTGHTSTTPAAGRQFDVNSNSFALSYAKLGFGVASEPVGLRVDLGYGATGQIINTAIPAEAALQGAPVAAVSPFLVQQAFASVVLPLRVPVTVDFGKFVTSASAEVIEANKNWLYSRSLMFFNTPLLHNGLRVTAKLSDALSVQASVVNGWNGTGFLPDLDKNKTFGVNVAYTAPSKTSIVLNTYFGKNENTGIAAGAPTSSGFRFIGELVVTQEVSDRLSVYLDAQYLKDGRSTANGGYYDNFIGAAVAGRYLVAPHLTLAARGEFYKNGSQKVGEGTLMVGVPLENRFELRIEGRGDFANQAIFNPGAAGVTTDKKQITGLAAFLAWF